MAGNKGLPNQNTKMEEHMQISFFNNGRESVLVVGYDMDGVTVDFEQELARTAIERGIYTKEEADEKILFRKEFHIHDDRIKQLIKEPGFYRRLKPKDGAIDTLRRVSEIRGVIVKIVSSPLYSAPNSATEKIHWMQEYLPGWCETRLVLTKDKSIFHGSLLIDDKPPHLIKKDSEIIPWPFELVVFDMTYNRESEGVEKHRRVTWENHDEIVLPKIAEALSVRNHATK